MTDTTTETDGDFDGDGLPPPPDEEHRFPCEQCGAQLTYRPGETVLTCPYCGHEQHISPGSEDAAEAAFREHDFERALGGAMAGAEYEESRVVACPNCGARVEIAEVTQATRCPFCDTPVITDTGTHRHIKPQGVVPFALTEDRARDELKVWLRSLWFAPNALKDYARHGRAMNGVYVPYWTFDADTRSQYTGMRGDHYYVTRTVMRDGKRQTVRERRTRWRAARGRVSRFFDDVIVLASRSLPKKYADALEPWNLSEMKPYAPEWLAGFSAEGYQVELPDGYSEARQIMDGVIRQDVRADIGGDVQRISSLHTDVNDVTFKHVLLPIWIAAYKFRGQTYRFVVNGQSGEVQGERPYSPWKIAFAVILGLIAAGIAFYVYGQTQ
ncbi:hypothetical protein [Wenxinia marina]|uniref:Replication restart DNA helicase PriA n=1 Tax=Wenxinia marina DSM 24838 TaxID=1123501 RepID=A0A0D0PE57_9RHOB|nr:hypothetical protein [Wenxinia marina]KIQ69686.1 hypothetical protein Wenmar_02050 [Wenxinia marina DSM 24838]GGL60363.1 hypothetical protein GCM10011392_13570 [Wenxinia marina]